jgi:uncharacterized membrane protein
VSIKRFVVAFLQSFLWYEAQFWSDRVAFAGGVVAGTLITLVAGMVGLGYGFTQAVGAVVFSIVCFVVIVFFAGCVYQASKKYGDTEPLKQIVKEWMMEDEKPKH